MRNRVSSRISSRSARREADALLLHRLAFEGEQRRMPIGRHAVGCACWGCVIALHRWVAAVHKPKS